MNDRETLFIYRMNEAEETLTDTRKSIVHTGKMGREYSRMLHRIFDARKESDYKEFVRFTNDDAAEYLRMAEEFLRGIKAFIAESKNN